MAIITSGHIIPDGHIIVFATTPLHTATPTITAPLIPRVISYSGVVLLQTTRWKDGVARNSTVLSHKVDGAALELILLSPTELSGPTSVLSPSTRNQCSFTARVFVEGMVLITVVNRVIGGGMCTKLLWINNPNPYPDSNSDHTLD